MSLSKTELSLIAKLLKESSNEFSNHGCNDYYLDNTEENKKLLVNLWTNNVEGEDLEEEFEEIKSNKDKKLHVYDWLLMDYLANRCEEEVK